jgi:hypothetical protein
MLVAVFAIHLIQRRIENNYNSRVSRLFSLQQLLACYYDEKMAYPERLEFLMPREELDAIIEPFHGNLRYESLRKDTYTLYEIEPRRKGFFEKFKLTVRENQWITKPD